MFRNSGWTISYKCLASNKTIFCDKRNNRKAVSHGLFKGDVPAWWNFENHEACRSWQKVLALSEILVGHLQVRNVAVWTNSTGISKKFPSINIFDEVLHSHAYRVTGGSGVNVKQRDTSAKSLTYARQWGERYLHGCSKRRLLCEIWSDKKKRFRPKICIRSVSRPRPPSCAARAIYRWNLPQLELEIALFCVLAARTCVVVSEAVPSLLWNRFLSYGNHANYTC